MEIPHWLTGYEIQKKMSFLILKLHSCFHLSPGIDFQEAVHKVIKLDIIMRTKGDK